MLSLKSVGYVNKMSTSLIPNIAKVYFFNIDFSLLECWVRTCAVPSKFVANCLEGINLDVSFLIEYC